MKTTRILALLFAALMVLPDLPASAAQILKLDNNNPLNQGGSWNGGLPPGPSDVAAWDSTVATAANCTNALTDDVSSLTVTWGGIQISNPAAPVMITTNTAGTSTAILIGSLGIDLSNATVDLTLSPAVSTVADQVWNIASGRTIAFRQNVNITNNLTVNGHVTFTNTFSVLSNTAPATLTISNPNTLIESTNYSAGSIVRVGNGATVNQSAGTLKLGCAAPSGNITTLSIGSSSSGGGPVSGIYNLTGGLIVDTNSQNANARIFVGNAPNATATLNVSGTGSMLAPDLRICAQGDAIVNVFNGGTIVIATNGTIDTGELSVGRGGVNATLNIYTNGTVIEQDGNLKVSNASAGTFDGSNILNVVGGTLIAGRGLLMINGGGQPAFLNLESGTITITNNLVLPSAGGTGASNAYVNLNGGILTVSAVTVGNGVVNQGYLNLNGGTLRPRVGGGALITNRPGLFASVKAGGAVIDTAGLSVSIHAALLNGTGGADGGLTKLSAGTLTLTNVNTYTGSTIISNGTLALTGGASIASSTNISIAAGATFDVSALSTTFTLGSIQTLGNRSSTATLAGSVDASSGKLSFQYASGTPSLQVASGTLTLSSSTTVTINNTGAALAAGSYQIVSATGGSVAGTVPAVTVAGNGLVGGATASLQINSGSLYLVVAVAAPSIPVFSSVVLSGTNLVSSGTNGPPSASYRVMCSTNVSLALTNWTVVATNVFDGSGNFKFTNAVDPAKPAQFYDIVVPVP